MKLNKFKLDENKIMKSVEKSTIEHLNKQKYEVKCPNCNAIIEVPTGLSNCPICNQEIDLNLKISFDK